MHDIGKVRTPKEILNKPDKLTDEEFVIMRRHVVDGAEILRRTPEMPILAPVVAFEHHLRLDGSGYPFTVKREALNLGSMLCSIADVYDAMRSQRAYQQALPDRSHPRGAEAQRRRAVRSAPGSPLRAAARDLSRPAPWSASSTGEIAVVLRVHAPDPYRPRVRVLFDADGARLELPFERNLWRTAARPDRCGHARTTVDVARDPADYRSIRLRFLEDLEVAP